MVTILEHDDYMILWGMGSKHNGMEWISLNDSYINTNNTVHLYCCRYYVEPSLDSVSVELEIVSISSLDSPSSSSSRQQI